MEGENDPIIIDIGSGHMKAGFASDDAPRNLIPMMLGKPKSKGALVGMDQKEWYIGNEVVAKKQFLNVEYPVEQGRIQDMEKMRQIFLHLMNDVMQCTLEEHKVIVTEPPNNDPKIREQLIDLMFTEFRVPKLYIGNQAVLSLFADGKTTGTVLDVGEGITHTVPIYEGYAIPFATTEIGICGKDLTKYMHSMLHAKDPSKVGAGSADLAECEKIKIEHGQVAIDFDAEMKQANEVSSNSERKYLLPGGHWVTIKEERLKCPELLFVPT